MKKTDLNYLPKWAWLSLVLAVMPAVVVADGALPIFVECDSCQSEASFQYSARNHFLGTAQPFIIANTLTKAYRSYLVYPGGAPMGHSGQGSVNQPAAYNGPVVEPYPLNAATVTALLSWIDLLHEAKTVDEMEISEPVVLGNGEVVSSVWDLLGNSGNQTHFINYLNNNVSWFTRFYASLHTLLQYFYLLPEWFHVNIVITLADGSTLRVAYIDEKLVLKDFKDSDGNLIPLFRPDEPVFSARFNSVENLERWEYWMSGYHWFFEIQQPWSDACRTYYVECHDEWRNEPPTSNTGDTGSQQTTEKPASDGSRDNQRIWVYTCIKTCT